MRFYIIKITKKNGKLFVPPSMAPLGLTDASYTSYSRGHLTSALDVMFDIPMTTMHTPNQDGGLIRILGVGLKDLGQSNDLAGGTLEIKAGMKKGLPLAVPKTPDLLVKGTIRKCFGNWEGNVTSLDMVVQALVDDEDKPPRNITFNWQDGQKLSEAIEEMLTNGFPTYEINVNISDKLVGNGQQVAYFGTLAQAAIAIKQATMHTQFAGIKRIDGSPYQGVTIAPPGANIINVYDGTTSETEGHRSPNGAIEVSFIDLIGQPTWINPNVVSFKTVLRGDIGVGDYVKLPKGLATPYVLTTIGGAQPMPDGDEKATSRNNLAFQGTFEIRAMQHFAHFRQADGGSWATSFEGIAGNQDEDTTSTPSSEGDVDTSGGGDGTSVGKQELPNIDLPPPREAPPVSSEEILAGIRPSADQQPRPTPPSTPIPADRDYI